MPETTSPMPVALLEWRPLKQNSLRGFATVRIGAALKVADVTVHCSAGRRWASMPSKVQINKEGVALRDERGKMKYVPLISWMDKGTADRFSEGVIQAIEAQYPGDTESDF
jgi:hypothetical protein